MIGYKSGNPHNSKKTHKFSLAECSLHATHCAQGPAREVLSWNPCSSPMTAAPSTPPTQFTDEENGGERS